MTPATATDTTTTRYVVSGSLLDRLACLAARFALAKLPTTLDEATRERIVAEVEADVRASSRAMLPQEVRP